MSVEYLAAGFSDVDTAEDSGAYSKCLSLLDSLPYFKEYKAESYDLLGLAPGDIVLDAGCGLGDDVFRMAELVAPEGKVVGLDSSSKLISLAETDHRCKGLPVELRQGDLLETDFADASFTKVRIDRVLQHISDPRAAISELVRVLRKGGSLLAHDNDWGTFHINSEQKAITRLIENAWCDSFKSGWIGRYLPQLLKESGLSTIAVHPKVSVISDLGIADAIYNLWQTVSVLAENGEISADEGRSWIEELQNRYKNGYFAVTLTAYSVTGQKI